MKICSKCKAEKPIAEFYKHAYTSDGRRPNCKVCSAAYYLENRAALIAQKAVYRSANPEKIKATSAEYRASSREKINANEAARYVNNRDTIRAKSAAYYAANREAINAKQAAYRAANPGKLAEKNRNRRARKISAEGSHSASDIIEIFTAQRGFCANCKAKLFKSGVKKFHVDHIMPLALGGSNWPSNLQCLCPPCNLSKSAKHPDVWAKQQGKLL